MEKRKQEEIEYYDKETEQMSLNGQKESGSGYNFDPFLLNSYCFLRQLVQKKAKDKKILDYGCGTGVHLTWLAETGSRAIGIDLSLNSLKLAQEKINRNNFQEKAEALLMDCEKLDFSDNSFNVIFDGGTFSSLDLSLVFPELVRVLKPDGSIIGIETFGHNPLTNLKRTVNKIRGKRTGWAADHIFKAKDLIEAKKHFNQVKVYYFHLISWLAFPFINLPAGKILLKILEFIDKILLKLFFLKKYSFKIVFIFSGPKK
jgi:ubiquinone/menaquinone biosynthesis C-methylase UbiE